jgi:hypothetical protein
MLLSTTLKKELLERAKNVAHVRSQITLSAKVHWMPPVEIVDEVWICTEGTIHGKATPIKVGNLTYMGVQLPAQTGIHNNNEELRAILVHEFAHCFYFAEQCVIASESGKTTVTSMIGEDIYDNEEADRARLPNLSDWFDDADVAKFAYWDDARLNSIDQNIEKLGALPKVSPKLRFMSRVRVEKQVFDHIRKLRNLPISLHHEQN